MRRDIIPLIYKYFGVDTINALNATAGTAGVSQYLLTDVNKNVTGAVFTTTTLKGVTSFGTGALLAGPAPIAVGASATASGGSGTYLLNAVAGSTLTLPAATGTGNQYRVLVTATTTSNAHKILAASSSDFINGISYGFTGSTAKVFASAAATNHSIQMPFTGSQPSGGFIGDWFEVTDSATNLWTISGFYQAGTTPTTPYSTATT